jgi:dienelactone hydrolase
MAIGTDADRAAAYRAIPASGRGRGVLVLDDARGLGFARDVCDRLARAGFVALGLDEPGPTGGERTGALVDAAIEMLLCDDATDGARIGVLGFGRGGSQALASAARNARVGAVVDFYGGAPDGFETASLVTPVLACFGEADEAVTRGAPAELEARFAGSGARFSLRLRAGAGHGYMDPSRADSHDAAGAAEGWDALIALFRAEL